MPEAIRSIIPSCIFGVIMSAKIDCSKDGKLSSDFSKGSLRPLVFAHGLCSNKEMYQGLYKDFASHGYMVVAMDHLDGSCIYTEKVGYKKRDFYDKEFRKT